MYNLALPQNGRLDGGHNQDPKSSKYEYVSYPLMKKNPELVCFFYKFQNVLL